MSITVGLLSIVIGVLSVRGAVLARDLPGISKRLSDILSGQVVAMIVTGLVGFGAIMILNAAVSGGQGSNILADALSWAAVVGMGWMGWYGLGLALKPAPTDRGDAVTPKSDEPTPKPHLSQGQSRKKRAA